ncbi:MAG: ribonuclease P protein component [Chloroflexi bacterium]|nr:ribonuclease P protein component [Chloroflexota bacterium]
MRRSLRLRRSADIQRVLREGKSWANRCLVLYAARRTGGHNRHAFVTGKRLGNAVTRNRLKRRMRAIVAKRLDDMEDGWDMVFIVRRGAVKEDFSQNVAAVDQLLRRAGLLRSARPGEGDK